VGEIGKNRIENKSEEMYHLKKKFMFKKHQTNYFTMKKGKYLYHICISLLLFIFLSVGCSNDKKKKNETTPKESQKISSELKYNPDQLFQSALNGDSGEVQKLLENGVNVNNRDQEGRTALMYAAFNGHDKIIETLLKYETDLNLRDNNGRTALMFAASGSSPNSVKLLLENGAKPNIQDKVEHFTALMFAAAEGQLENVKLLLQYGAQTNIKDIDGDDALTFADNNGHQQVVDFLKNLK